MEEIIDEMIFLKVKFFASYDTETGKLMCVGPEHALTDMSNKIEIDEDIAEMIIVGKILMQSCSVNLDTFKLETESSKKEITINDKLFKIPLKKNIKYDQLDISFLYYKKSKTLKISLDADYQKSSLINRYQLLNSTSFLDLVISDNNDPNCIHDIISVSFAELIKKTKVIKNINFSEKQSIYIKKTFLKYALEII